MSEWTSCKLGDLVDIKIGGTPSRAIPGFWATEYDDGFPWVSIADLQKKLLITTKEEITRSGVLSSNVKLINEGSLIMSFKLSIGRAAIAGCDLYTNEAIAGFIPKAGICTDFLYYVLPLAAQRAVTDTAVKGATLNSKSLGALDLRIPVSVQLQQKIARILQTIDQAIEKTEQLIGKYQQIKAGLMHDLFTRGIGADGQLRPPREQAPDLYQQTPIGWLPKEWELLQLSHMAVSGVPVLKTGPFGSSLKGEHWVDDGVPVITIGSLGDDEFIQDELLFISERYAEVLNEYRMKDGQIVFSRVADVGRSVVIREPQSGWVMSSNMMRIHLDHSVIQPEFLQKQLSSLDSIKTQIRCRVNSGGREVANSEILNSLQFVCPSINEQQMIIDRSDLVGARLNTELDNLQKLLKQKSGLMHDLLTGTVPVSVDPGSEVNA